ncbi:hypothetical protein CRI94_17035 [Longibacter salinarum]|uniref:Uncharacterized protein n=1 Tax=Longibacter salinarum TaxID=1850348 RepID=A0A2A8CTG3_9BACT|nr:hypothetical protein [Longibacter salinarum]PEN10937.1 hypothetical protein CRI94_17035 [Longibacter salinarum]
MIAVPHIRPAVVLLLLIPGLLAVTGCSSSPDVPEGKWTGALTPMNHPEMQTSVAYNVATQDGGLMIDVIGPNGNVVRAQQPELQGDTLAFRFPEPEENVMLTCRLGRTEEIPDGFAGRCTDENGQWARFTMRPPAT